MLFSYPKTGKSYFVEPGTSFEEWKEKVLKRDSKSGKIDVTEGGKYKYLSSEEDYKALAGSQRITKEQSEQVWSRDDGKLGYIQAQHNYKNINGYLRGQINAITPDNQKTIAILDKLTTNNKLKQDLIGIRKVDSDYLPNVLDVEGFDESNHSDVEKALANIKDIAGKEIEDKAFTSISLLEDNNYFTRYPVKFTIKMPKGTKGLVTNNIDESEFITAKNSKLKIIDAETYKPSENDKQTYINIIAELIQ